MVNKSTVLTFLLSAIAFAACSSVPRSDRSPSGTGANDGATGNFGSRGKDGQSGKAFFITSCDGLIATAVYRTSRMGMWQDELQDMCSVRPETTQGLVQAHEGLNNKIERLFATGYLRDQELPSSFGESRSTELEKLTLKMIYVNELDKKVASRELVDFGCHRAKIINRHKEERIYSVCLKASLVSLSREGDVSVDLNLRAFEIKSDGTVDSSAHIIERTRLSSLPPTCEKGIPVFQHSSVESNGTQFKQTVASSCEAFVIDSEGVFPTVDIRFEHTK